MSVVRFERAMFGRIGFATVVAMSVPAIAQARTPLPTIEVVQPKRPVRLLDLRWSLQVGGALALGDRVPLLALGQTMHVSFVELGKTMQLHAALGNTALVDASRGWRARRGVLGVDLGLGISRHRPGGPALALTFTAGPRWSAGSTRARSVSNPASWRVDGWGVIGQLDVYPFYLSMPEIIEGDARWFRRYVLSGLGLWTAVRYDALRGGMRTPAIVAGGGFDLGRAVITPLVLAATARPGR